MNPRNVAACALFLAVFLGSVAMAHGRSMERVEPKSAIAKAIEEGDDAEAGRILGEYELRQCYFGQSPATLAAEYGRLGILKKILERGASIEGTECWSGTPLLEAAGQGHVEVVRYLLSKGATPNPSVKSRRTPLLAAIEDPLFFHAKQEGSKETLKIVLLLLDAGADPNASDQLERTPLILAVRNADARLARLLLPHGADPNVKGSRGKSALDLAKADRLDYIASLLEGKPPGKSEGGNTALLDAVKGNNLAEVTRLLGGGADVNARDDGGSPPLIHAASLGHSAIAEALIAKGADVNIRNGKNGTALIYASAGGITKLVEALLEKGAEVDAKDHAGNTSWNCSSRAEPAPTGKIKDRNDALQVAIKANHPAIVKILMAKSPAPGLPALRGADPNARDEKGLTPWRIAMLSGHNATVKALEKGGAAAEYGSLAWGGNFFGGGGGPSSASSTGTRPRRSSSARRNGRTTPLSSPGRPGLT